MLCAQTKDGDTVCLPPYNRTEINELRKYTTFYCPSCKEKLMIKNGTEITPHFSHQSVSACSGGGEGEDHERGKWLLYRWLQEQIADVHLEYYLEKTHQRPDIFFKRNTYAYAVEFQYSSVPSGDIRKRNQAYNSIQITPIWFLDRKHFQQRGQHTFIINAFAKQFLCQPPNHNSPVLFFFCTRTKTIIALQHISFITQTKAFGKKVVYPIESSFWEDIFQVYSFSRKIYLQRWLEEKRKFRLQYRNGIGKQRKWLEWLYEHQLSIDYLPSVVHLPVKGQVFMKVQLWNWQSRLWYYIQYKQNKNNTFTIQDCHAYLAPYMYPQTYYPLLQNSISPVESYIEWLCILGFVYQETEETFALHESIPKLTHIEEAIKQDYLLMNYIQELSNRTLSKAAHKPAIAIK